MFFSVFSHVKDVGAKKSLYGSEFLNFFNNTYYVSNNEKTPSFLDGVTFKYISGSLEFGFWSKKEKLLVVCENDFFDVYSQSSRWQPKKLRQKQTLPLKTFLI